MQRRRTAETRLGWKTWICIGVASEALPILCIALMAMQQGIDFPVREIIGYSLFLLTALTLLGAIFADVVLDWPPPVGSAVAGAFFGVALLLAVGIAIDAEFRTKNAEQEAKCKAQAQLHDLNKRLCEMTNSKLPNEGEDNDEKPQRFETWLWVQVGIALATIGYCGYEKNRLINEARKLRKH